MGRTLPTEWYLSLASSQNWSGGLIPSIATDRLNDMIDGYNWTIEDTYAAQTMCPYETVAYGFSRFCGLFTYEEWVGFGYSIDLYFYGDTSFGSPTGVS